MAKVILLSGSPNAAAALLRCRSPIIKAQSQSTRNVVKWNKKEEPEHRKSLQRGGEIEILQDALGFYAKRRKK